MSSVLGRVLVAGAGGFIGGHIVARLRADGYRHIRAVDSKPLCDWYQTFPDVESWVLDLRVADQCLEACRGMAEVYNFASDMGGMGFIESHKAECMLSVLINTHLLMAARESECRRYFFASSACIYPGHRQQVPEVVPLREDDAYPADPEDGYGWEKLFGERMCRHFLEDFGLETRVARLHNVYGPYGTFAGGREKAPAAICRKVISAVQSGRDDIEIWGDGSQTRSFMYIDDCVEGVMRLMRSSCREPLNLGSSERVSVNHLVGLVEDIAGVSLRRIYQPAAPTGVQGRNSDNTRARQVLGWEPSTPLRIGLRATYDWIAREMARTDTPAPLQVPVVSA